MATHILSVDDDALMRRSLAFSLEQAGYRVSSAGTAEEALSQAAADPPDLVLLDIGLPGMDGLEGLRHLQAQTNAPVIFVTARRRQLEQVLGLELGADDYITKPFDTDVLLARIRAVLRRYQRAQIEDRPTDTCVRVDDLVIDPKAHTALIGDEAIELSPREFDLLLTLAQSAGQVVTTDELLSGVWGEEFLGEPQVVYVHMRRLREKIELDPAHPKRVVTVRGVGYKYAKSEDSARR
jgi:DNA-binding response OmpR family regulator